MPHATSSGLDWPFRSRKRLEKKLAASAVREVTSQNQRIITGRCRAATALAWAAIRPSSAPEATAASGTPHCQEMSGTRPAARSAETDVVASLPVHFV